MNNGKVYLVGAGPGDAGLLTVKGLEVLQNAEVVVYDSLVGQGILSKIPKTARMIYVGKRASCHTMKQEQINELLLKEARSGYQVVRLKGGDPFLFGRGGEELELLWKHGIPYEIVPGIPSALSVPAYHGIPVTHRELVSSLHIITGHKKNGEPCDIDFEALVRTHGTLVFLMSLHTLPEIMNGLILGGMSPEMPAAVLEKGTTADQKRIVATVGTLKEKVEEIGAEAPVLLIVGEVCALAEKFCWCEKLPLFGWKVLITRPEGRMSETAALLRKRGAEVIELPAIATAAIPENALLQTAFDRLECYDWLVFTSPTGVEIFFKELLCAGKDIRALGNVKVAVIGEGTGKKLKEHGIFADLMPEVYDGDALGDALAKQLHGGERILIPRAKQGNENLVRILEAAGGKVEDIPTYQTVYETRDWFDAEKEFTEGKIDCVVFTSASTVKGFVSSAGTIDFSRVRAACIGKQTKAAADAFGMKSAMAERATMESLVQLVERMKKEAGEEGLWI